MVSLDELAEMFGGKWRVVSEHEWRKSLKRGALVITFKHDDSLGLTTGAQRPNVQIPTSKKSSRKREPNKDQKEMF